MRPASGWPPPSPAAARAGRAYAARLWSSPAGGLGGALGAGAAVQLLERDHGRLFGAAGADGPLGSAGSTQRGDAGDAARHGGAADLVAVGAGAGAGGGVYDHVHLARV